MSGDDSRLSELAAPTTHPIRGVEDSGILDHDFIDPMEGKWTVPARVVRTSTGSLFIMTLKKPDGMPHEAFERGLKELDDELAQLARLTSYL
jgi:hypothetical protein